MSAEAFRKYMDTEERVKRHLNLLVRQRILRETTNPFDMDSERFQTLYRFDKTSVQKLITETAPYMESPRIPFTIRIFAALHYFVHGTHQADFARVLHNAQFENVCMVADALQKLKPKWVNLPEPDEYDAIKEEFFKKTGFPGVIGAVDCIHIRIVKPKDDVEKLYLNEERYHSFNVQLICDFNLKVLDASSNHGGSTRDITIWDNARVSSILQTRYKANKNMDAWLLGDSRYKLLPWLLIPYRRPTNDDQKKFNKMHGKARNCTFRLGHVLKTTFRCLREINANPEEARKIIDACIVLHNIRLSQGLVENNCVNNENIWYFDEHANEHICHQFEYCWHLEQGGANRDRVKAKICEKKD